MEKKHPRITDYREFVYSNVPAYLLNGGGVYNISELASAVGLKPTSNFRRRVKELASQGIISVAPTFTPRGNIEARYYAFGAQYPIESFK